MCLVLCFREIQGLQALLAQREQSDLVIKDGRVQW